MNSFSDNQQLESFVPVYDAIPDKWDEARPFIVEQLKKISNAVNIREIGWFLDEELLSGKAFIPGSTSLGDLSTSQVFRQVLRKVIDFGPLPNAGGKSVPHGINFDSNFTLVQFYGAATNPTNLLAIPIPYAHPSTTLNTVALAMDSTNVIIATGINWSPYTRVFITIEYMQEL